jgi:hypothetical protein
VPTRLDRLRLCDNETENVHDLFDILGADQMTARQIYEAFSQPVGHWQLSRNAGPVSRSSTLTVAWCS